LTDALQERQQQLQQFNDQMNEARAAEAQLKNELERLQTDLNQRNADIHAER